MFARKSGLFHSLVRLKNMLALIVIAHPSMSSFSHAMATVAQDILSACGYSIAMHDLYTEKFDPVQSAVESSNTTSDDALVEQHCADLVRADLILIFHPNWWSQPPAILKGWVDRVFRLNTAYGYPLNAGFEAVPVGLLKARAALVFNTSNTPLDRELAIFGDPLDHLWKTSIFGLCGVERVTRRMFAPVSSSTAAERETWLGEVKELVKHATEA